MKRGVLVVISAPSGCGKDTVINELLKMDGGFCYSVSATTRKKREGEEDGVSYFFISKQEFEELIKDGGVIEYTVYCGEYYGTPKAYVERMLDSGKNVVLKIETEGMSNIKKLYPDAITFFILPPDMQTLKDRLTSRGTELPEVIEKRLRRAEEEMKCAPYYDHRIYNYDHLAAETAKEIIKTVNAVRSAENTEEE